MFAVSFSLHVPKHTHTHSYTHILKTHLQVADTMLFFLLLIILMCIL